MKRLIALLMAAVLGVVLFTAPMIADPGNETNTDSSTTTDTTAVWTDQNYPPPPPEYVGPWPPPDQTASTDCDDGDEDPWEIPK